MREKLFAYVWNIISNLSSFELYLPLFISNLANYIFLIAKGENMKKENSGEKNERSGF